MNLSELQLLERIIDYGTSDVSAVDLVRASQIIKREIQLKTMNVRLSKEEQEKRENAK